MIFVRTSEDLFINRTDSSAKMFKLLALINIGQKWQRFWNYLYAPLTMHYSDKMTSFTLTSLPQEKKQDAAHEPECSHVC